MCMYNVYHGKAGGRHGSYSRIRFANVVECVSTSSLAAHAIMGGHDWTDFNANAAFEHVLFAALNIGTRLAAVATIKPVLLSWEG